LERLAQELSGLDTAVSQVQKQIEMMKEYRMALIAEAVTGKIDVRAKGCVAQPK
jgi:type I restriction enzyme, S subunit